MLGNEQQLGIYIDQSADRQALLTKKGPIYNQITEIPFVEHDERVVKSFLNCIVDVILPFLLVDSGNFVTFVKWLDMGHTVPSHHNATNESFRSTSICLLNSNRSNTAFENTFHFQVMLGIP